MKKVLIVFEGPGFSAGAASFAFQLNEIQPLLLTGIFLPHEQMARIWNEAVATGDKYYFPLLESAESELVQRNTERFRKLCEKHHIEYRIHNDFSDLIIPELKKESRFADLLILGSNEFYTQHDPAVPNEYLIESLHTMECPVLVVPEKFDFPENIILAYDGSGESVYAIKQFASLFSELASLETTLVYAYDKEPGFPDQIQIEELAARHFEKLTFTSLDNRSENLFVNWLAEKKSALLVCGSYGRSGVSRLFRKSFARDIISELAIPVFVAHK
ncbi:MAG: universal stress protein [Chitinophagaceae bacterium]|nr:universal stress protein [Chitinophagaceae bacterium]